MGKDAKMGLYSVIVFGLCFLNHFEVAAKRNFTIIQTDQTPLMVSLDRLTNASSSNGDRRYPCYVSVKTYADQSFSEKKKVENVTVYVLSMEKSGIDKPNSYIGFSEALTDNNGIACVLTLCYKDAIIYASSGVEKLLHKGKQRVPFGFQYNYTNSFMIYVPNVRDFGEVFGISGPVYVQSDYSLCKKARVSMNFFKFFFTGPPDKLTINPAYKLAYDPSKSWYPFRELEPGFRRCFLKIKFRTKIFNATVEVKSINAKTQTWYGTYISGPKQNPDDPDPAKRAACIEYRCPIQDPDNPGTDIPTRLEGKLTLPPGVQCNLEKSNVSSSFKSWISSGLITNYGFNITLKSDDDYGPNDGIFINPNKDFARSQCYTGSNFPGKLYEMNPDTGYAILYTCIGNKGSSTPFG